jgi:hypothetical protein
MPSYVYVKIILRITSYSTLFILKRNTGNCFYLLSYIHLSGMFLERVHQKTLYRTTHFLFIHSLTCHFLFGCRYTNGCPLTTPPAHWRWRGTAYRWEARLIEARIIEVLLYMLCVMDIYWFYVMLDITSKLFTITVFVIADVRTVFHIWCIGMFMIRCAPDFMYRAWTIYCALAPHWVLNKIIALLPYCYCTCGKNMTAPKLL